jgi:hypothetical protein
VFAALSRVQKQLCSSVLGVLPSSQFVLINLGISRLDGRCSPGFQSSSGVFLSLSLRSLYLDQDRCSTSATPPPQLVYRSLQLLRFLVRSKRSLLLAFHHTSPRFVLFFCVFHIFCLAANPTAYLQISLLSPYDDHFNFRFSFVRCVVTCLPSEFCYRSQIAICDQ